MVQNKGNTSGLKAPRIEDFSCRGKRPEKWNCGRNSPSNSLPATNFRELCREYFISAKTCYKWQKRFIAHGLAGLGDESRKPDSHSASLDEETIGKIVKLKNAHQHWGPRKIRALYQRQHNGADIPSESSF